MTRRQRPHPSRVVAAVAIEVALYWSYLGGDGPFHWFTHFFAGTSFALLVMTLVSVRTRRPVPVPLLWLVMGHLAAMGPDLLFVNEMAHQRWMDVFVGHNVTHFMPGRNLTWYAIFLVGLAAYLSVIGRGSSNVRDGRSTSPTRAVLQAGSARR